MKRILALIVILAIMVLPLAGCSTISAVGTAIANVAQKICDFTKTEGDQAQSASTFIGTVASIVGPVAGVKVTSDVAAATFMEVYNAVSTGACVGAPALQNAVDYFNALAIAYQAATVSKGFRPMNPIPDISLLRKRVGK